MAPHSSVEPFTDLSAEPAVRGFLHLPAGDTGNALVLTHGAGANCQSKLLVAVASAFADAGIAVLRCDLPFRQVRRHGPPFPASAARDREGLRRAANCLRQRVPGRVFLGGHSYGGRQATMLLAEWQSENTPAHDPESDGTTITADVLKPPEGLLLLSYPLHPPRKPTELRTGHFPRLQAAALFVHGSSDPFGSIAELRSAIELIRARTLLVEAEGVGHDLLLRKTPGALPARIVERFLSFFSVKNLAAIR